MTPAIYVWIKTQFEALHHWPDAAGSVAYLRNPHRHMFHVRVDVRVSDGDRQVEFITLKHLVDNIIMTHVPKDSTWSCEHMANAIGDELRQYFRQAALLSSKPEVTLGFAELVVRVSEDDENGATLIWSE